MRRVRIAELSCYIPERIVTNEEVLQQINQREKFLQEGVLERLFGIKERRYAAIEEQASDLAVKAAEPIISKVGKHSIDLLIFAAASQDLIEPATSNIIQHKLGLDCPCMDIKNACNGFVSAMQTASAFIQSGMYENILIVNGEKLSLSVNYKIENSQQLMRSLAAFTLGDAGTAMLLTPSKGDEGIHHQAFKTVGKHWDLCTIQGGGSMFPRDPSKMYFEGKTTELKDAILSESRDFVQTAFKKPGWASDDIQYLFTHQVSKNSFKYIAEGAEIDLNKSFSIFEYYGNTAAASIPLAMCIANQQQKLKVGDKIALIGLAAGISISIQYLVWG